MGRFAWETENQCGTTWRWKQFHFESEGGCGVDIVLRGKLETHVELYNDFTENA